MTITRVAHKYYNGKRWIERPDPIYVTSAALKLVLNELKSHKLKYKVTYKSRDSAYINVLIPKGDYIMEIRVSNHSQQCKQITLHPFNINKGYILKTDIHTYESLERFLSNFKNYIR